MKDLIDKLYILSEILSDDTERLSIQLHRKSKLKLSQVKRAVSSLNVTKIEDEIEYFYKNKHELKHGSQTTIWDYL